MTRALNYKQQDIKKVWPNLKPRQLQHFSEIGLVKLAQEPGGPGDPRLYSYRNLIEIGIILTLEDIGVALRDVRYILERKDVKKQLATGGYDFVFGFSGSYVTMIQSKDHKPVRTSLWPVYEGVSSVEDYRPFVEESVMGFFVNVAQIRKHIALRLG